MKADFMVKSNSFLSLCPLLPCYHLYYLPLCSLLEILLSWGVRGLIPACTSIPFFFSLFRGLLSSCHFLVLCQFYCLISPYYTFFLRGLHPVSWLQLKAQSRDQVSKISSNSYFVQVVLKAPFLWIHNALSWQRTGLDFSPKLTIRSIKKGVFMSERYILYVGSVIFNELVTKLGIPTSVSFPYQFLRLTIVTHSRPGACLYDIFTPGQ